MADLLQALGQKREREDVPAGQQVALAAGNAAPRPSLLGFGGGSARNNRRAAGGMGMLMGGAMQRPAPAAAAPSTAAAGGMDLLAQLGMGTSFVQEAADRDHLGRVSSSLHLGMHNTSLITSLFSSGAPQYDVFNDPFLAVKSADRPLLVDEKLLAERLGRLHHPLSTLEGSLLATEIPPPPIQLKKTPDELKKERKARGAAKREAHQAKVKEGKVAEDQKLRLRNLETNLKDRFEQDMLGTLAIVDAQIKERQEAHNDANYQRHMAALPHQMERREEKKLLKAETNVILNMYRVFPIREKASLGMFVEFANDQRLRGFVAWIDGRDAVVVLMGGPAPMRHLDNWLTQRMQWRSSADTICNKIFSTRVHDMERFSFHQKGGRGGGEDDAAGEDEGDDGVQHAALEPVYLKELKSVALAEEFFYETMPSNGPWPSLAFLWRSAMLAAPSND